MPHVNLHGRRFVVVENSRAGDAVVGETIFEFEQEGDLVSVQYSGGRVRKGGWIGVIRSDGAFEFLIQHVDTAGCLKGGQGLIRITTFPDGRLSLQEDWRFTIGGDGAGRATFAEVARSSLP